MKTTTRLLLALFLLSACGDLASSPEATTEPAPHSTMYTHPPCEPFAESVAFGAEHECLTIDGEAWGCTLGTWEETNNASESPVACWVTCATDEGGWQSSLGFDLVEQSTPDGVLDTGFSRCVPK